MLIAVVGSCRTTYAEATSQCRQNITDFHNFYNSKETICLNPEIMPQVFRRRESFVPPWTSSLRDKGWYACMFSVQTGAVGQKRGDINYSMQ